MANSEEAVAGLELILQQDFPTYLHQIEREYTDGVELQEIRSISWEEYADTDVLSMPAVMIVAEDETDPSLRDILYDCHVTVVFVIADTDKRNVTKKMFRYGKALRRMVKQTSNRSLRGKVNSAKVGAIRWLPGGRGGTGGTLFTRGFEADMVLRLPKEGD